MPQPLLRPLHVNLVQSKLVAIERLSTEELLISLKAGNDHCLKTRPDGTIPDGHHCIAILRSRGIEVDALPRLVVDRDDT